MLAPWAPPFQGLMIGQPQAAEEGMKVIAAGGNAVDAAVAGALVAGTVALLSSGIAGYGGHMVIAFADGRVRVVDFNTEAPRHPPARVVQHGWESVGVPGVLAGLEFALVKYGTRSFRECLQPAIRCATQGFALTETLGKSINQLYDGHFSKDPGAKKLFAPEGRPLGPGDTFRNPDLAAMLEVLARDNSAEAFYRGELARKLAKQYALHGASVTAEDLASYRAREVAPIEWRMGGHRVVTAPLTAGGATVVQALRSLESTDAKAEGWHHARLEALRIAWRDRLELFGDPMQVADPVPKLLSDATAGRAADRIRRAVAAGRALDINTPPVHAAGTTHLSVADRAGNIVSVTFTHGDGFGSRVVIPGYGLILGHGMSRFDPAPGHANGLAPRKRPLHNMCPTVLLNGNRPVAAIGATGGRRIPNAVFDILTRMLWEKMPLAEAVAAPRMNTTGDLGLVLSGTWAAADRERFARLGFKVVEGSPAVAQALALEPEPVKASG